MAFRLHRRTLLRATGAAVALPWLECMAPRRAHAQSGPRRYAIVFAGQSLGGDGWDKDHQMIGGQRFREDGHFIAPVTTGPGYAATTPLRPLEEAGLLEDVSLLSNLEIPYDRNSFEPESVPPGGAYRDFHGGACSPLLCGVRSTSAAFRAQGITSDQVVAHLQAGQTPFDSLVLRAQPSWYLSSSSYAGRQYISYRGANDRIEALTSPQVAFQTLFSNFTPEGAEAQARQAFHQDARRSVLDLIMSKRQSLLGRVGQTDRIRLEQHFDEIRALEQQIAAIPPVATGRCRVPDDPGEDPAIGADNQAFGHGEIATDTGYSNETERARAMADLIHMAFTCDLTRVATLQITTFQSHMNVFPITSALGTPVLADLHEVGHNGDPDNRGQLAVSTCLRWHVGHYADLVDKLKSTPEGDGSVLDHSAIVFMPEGGHGRQLNDGTTENQTHSTENMILMVAGRAGGLAPGRHIDGQRQHPAQGLISAMKAVGYPGDSLGEVTGPIPELFA